MDFLENIYQSIFLFIFIFAFSLIFFFGITFKNKMGFIGSLAILTETVVIKLFKVMIVLGGIDIVLGTCLSRFTYEMILFDKSRGSIGFWFYANEIHFYIFSVIFTPIVIAQSCMYFLISKKMENNYIFGRFYDSDIMNDTEKNSFFQKAITNYFQSFILAGFLVFPALYILRPFIFTAMQYIEPQEEVVVTGTVQLAFTGSDSRGCIETLHVEEDSGLRFSISNSNCYESTGFRGGTELIGKRYKKCWNYIGFTSLANEHDCIEGKKYKTVMQVPKISQLIND